MPLSSRHLWVSLLLCSTILTGASAMATKPSSETVKPPQTYRLDEVSLQITRNPGRASAPVRRVSLRGTGSAQLEQKGQKQSFQFATGDLVALLNELYKIHFFELPTNYRTRTSVFLRDDGSIATSQLRMSDESSTSVCFSVASYEKCVTYSTTVPDGLESIASRIFAESEKRVGAGQP